MTSSDPLPGVHGHARPSVRQAAVPVRALAGVSLVEWLIGLALGLLLSLAALEHLVLSLNGDGALAGQAQLASQAHQAMAVLSQPLRQAGSASLSPIDPTLSPADQVFLFDDALDALGQGMAGPSAVWGQEGGPGPDTLVVSHRAGPGHRGLDCLGQAPAPAAEWVSSRFWVTAGTLRCLGSGNSVSQPLSNEIEDLQLLYWLQTGQGADARYQLLRADEVQGRWAQVQAVEVCLQWAAVSRPLAASAAVAVMGCEKPLPGDGRARILLRQTFQIRGQGGFL